MSRRAPKHHFSPAARAADGIVFAIGERPGLKIALALGMTDAGLK